MNENRNETPRETGRALIEAKVATLPSAPGVYRMLDGEGNALYVGKAKNLKARVRSYARPTGHNNRILRMIDATRDMEFIRTETETDALLLEANLIKKMKPRYNVLLRDDKSFPYILLAEDHDVPQLYKHRGARKRPGAYFGPSHRPVRSIAPSTHCSAPFCCAHVPTVFMTAAPAPACSIKSNAAAHRAREKSRSPIMPNWSKKRAIF